MPDAFDWRGELRARLRGLNLSPEREAEIAEELAQHLDDRAAELRALGRSSDAIRDELLAELNQHQALAAAFRPVERQPRPVPPPLGVAPRATMIASLALDVRYAVRSLRKRAGLSAAVIVTLALGIGATTSIFSAVYALLVHPLPYPRSSELMIVGWKSSAPSIPSGFMPDWSYPNIRTLEENGTAFSSVGGFAQRAVILTGTDQAERLITEYVTAGYFPTLGVAAERGRTFTREEDLPPSGQPVVIISHDLWVRRFGGRSDIVNTTIEFSHHPFRVIGVAPAGFHGQSGSSDIWLPATAAATLLSPSMITMPIVRWLEVVGRLKPGVTRPQAETALVGVHRSIMAEMTEMPANIMESMHLIPMSEYKLDPIVSRLVLILFGAVGVVLLTGCVNIAILLLTRAVGRRREIAVRLALGATRRRVLQQLLTESLVLAVVGGAGGVLIALAGVKLVAAGTHVLGNAQFGVSASQLLGFYRIRLDTGVLAFNFAVAIVAGIAFGVLPAWKSSRADLSQSLKDDVRTRGFSLARHRINPRSVLVTVEVALAMILLAGAGLLVRSFVELRATRLGFDSRDVTVISFPTTAGHEKYNRLLARVVALPGVDGAGFATNRPFGGFVNMTSISVAGREESAPTAPADFGVHYAGGDLFATLHVPLIAGRVFTAADAGDAPRVAILNARAAHRLWPNQSAIGQRIHLDVNWPTGAMAEVVGVVGDVKYGTVEGETAPDVYLPFEQNGFVANLFVRSRLPAATILGAVQREGKVIDRDLVFTNVRTLDVLTSDAMARTRYSATLIGVLALLALFLAASGLYGVIAYSVSERSREIGVRMALGGHQRHILTLVLRQGMAVTLVGVACGVAGSFVLTRFLASMLYGVGRTDTVTFIATPALLLVVAAVACAVPARRALSVDPLVAMRSE